MHHGLDGLSSLRKICKARSCAKLACMIDADLVAIDHVSGSHRTGRVLHEVITFSTVVRCLHESCTLCRESEVCVVNGILGF